MFKNFTLPEKLVESIKTTSQTIHVPANETLVNIGDPMEFVPFVESGTVRVFIENDEVNKELLLYYVEDGETCMMSIIAGFTEKISKVSAITETPCTVVLIPNQKIREWQTQYEEWNNLILDIFVLRYTDLIKTINALSFQKIEDRLFSYLRVSADKNGKVSSRKTHVKIAKDIATSREVVTRTLKKLENENKIQITETDILVL